MLWDVITCSFPWYLLLTQHSWYSDTTGSPCIVLSCIVCSWGTVLSHQNMGQYEEKVHAVSSNEVKIRLWTQKRYPIAHLYGWNMYHEYFRNRSYFPVRSIDHSVLGYPSLVQQCVADVCCTCVSQEVLLHKCAPSTGGDRQSRTHPNKETKYLLWHWFF